MTEESLKNAINQHPLLALPPSERRKNTAVFHRFVELLMRQKGRVVTTEQFMERIWGYDSDVEISVVWAYISYLRRKLEAICSNVRIATRRGFGYLLEEIP